MKITDVRIVTLIGQERPAVIGDPQPQLNPIHLYAHDRETRRYPSLRAPASGRHEAIYLMLRTDTGLEGCYGPIDELPATIIDRSLRGFLIGEDPLAGELQWDRMQRSDRHARSGHYMMALSIVDNALWDLRGRHFDVPVYRLLGGPTRPHVEAYATMLAVSHESEALAAEARRVLEIGFDAQKYFFAYGPGDGRQGMARNVQLARDLREAVGPGVDLMFDAFSGWDRDYARRWIDEVASDVRPSWLEEPFMPEQTAAYAALRGATPVRIAGGEHLFTRWEADRYLRGGLVDVLQCDPEWCGGISEFVRIATVASLYDIPLIPHGHTFYASLHAVAALPPEIAPRMEFILNLQPVRHHFDRNFPTPDGNRFALPTLPGFGIEIDETKVVTSRAWD
jgi:L-alanine-DL-glutamate epimerase-like enolase superfamily enzyme